MDQKLVIIWVDAKIDTSKENYHHAVEQFRNIVNDVRIFKQLDDAIDFITKLAKRKAFVILSGDTVTHISTVIDDIQQIDSIYILSDEDSQHQAWATKSWKIRSIHTNIKSVCEALQVAVKHYNQDSILVSVAASNEGTFDRHLKQLNPSFMYTQILKEIFLEMKHDDKSIETFIQSWRNYHIGNTFEQKSIDEFERNYCSKSSIWWYTHESHIYRMLSRSLRELDVDAIINMGFFIRDLHKEIERLHREQINTYHQNILTVYRGQVLSKLDFARLVKSKGCLMSFNNFLSTSKNRELACLFMSSPSTETDLVGILFSMTIDLSVPSVPFASTEKLSKFREEEEILFSMHTVFRIGEIKRIDDNELHFQVDLELTANADEQLRSLTECMREEIVATTEWKRLGKLFLRLNQFDKAEELYNTMLVQASKQHEKADYYHQLGYIRHSQGDYRKAIEYYEKALEISEKTVPSTLSLLATSCNNLGGVYMNMGEYSKALLFYEKAVGLRQKSFSPNHPSLATVYNNIATMYYNMGEFPKALSLYEKALAIQQKTLSPTHADLATSYNNLGELYRCMKDYPQALSYYEKALEIKQKSLSPNHPSLATSYNNVASVYYNMEENSKAISYFERALKIFQISFSSDHPNTKTVQANIDVLKTKLKNNIE